MILFINFNIKILMIFPIYKILLDFSVTRSRDERERETTGGYYQSFT